VSKLVKAWLTPAPWSSVVSINASLCKSGKALHKPTSEGYEPCRAFWEKARSEEQSLKELLNIAFKCHRLAPFCNYNGNTFVTIVKTLLTDTLNSLSVEKAHILRSVAGHIVAGTATDIEEKQLEEILKSLEKK
jgi:hypothetical protein